MRQFDRMIGQKLYDPSDSELMAIRAKVRALVVQYNATATDDFDGKDVLLRQMLGRLGTNCFMEPNIRFDYGCNTYIGDNFYSNYDCKFIDVAEIRIGNNVMFGPNVTIATPVHPLVAKQRITRTRGQNDYYDLEYGKSVVIGDNVWIAANVVVSGGVTIGGGAVIGAGSIVTRDIPSNCIAVGNPCRILREITDKDLMDESDFEF